RPGGLGARLSPRRRSAVSTTGTPSPTLSEARLVPDRQVPARTPLPPSPRPAIWTAEFSRPPRRSSAPMAAQFIFQMQGLTKAYPGGKKVFENIWLSFYPDAKIGVVGVNGSGKSTLLKIMAGLDD